MPWHDVQQGDWVGDVCDQYGITNWQKVWDLGENADLKTLRKGSFYLQITVSYWHLLR